MLGRRCTNVPVPAMGHHFTDRRPSGSFEIFTSAGPVSGGVSPKEAERAVLDLTDSLHAVDIMSSK